MRRGFVWQEKYETAFALKPNGRKSKKGNWTPSSHKKMLRENNIVLCISGQWYYLGIYEHVLAEPFPPQEYGELPDKVRLCSCVP